MKRRVGILGTGWVGSSLAISALHSGIVDELLLHDRTDVAEGEAMDLAQGAAFYPTASVRRLGEGYSPQEAAEFLSVHIRTVFHWQSLSKKKGGRGLRAKPPSERPRKLTACQERTVLDWFRKNPAPSDSPPNSGRPAASPRSSSASGG